MSHDTIGKTTPSIAPTQRSATLAAALEQYRATECPEYDETLHDLIGRVAANGSLGKTDLGALLLWKRIRVGGLGRGVALYAGQRRPEDHGGCRSALPYFPGLLAARGPDVIAVECKARLGSTNTGRFAISRAFLRPGLMFLGTNEPVPLYYVFGDHKVLTPAEVMHYCSVSLRHPGGAYYLVSTRYAHPFSEVFGEAHLAYCKVSSMAIRFAELPPIRPCFGHDMTADMGSSLGVPQHM
jgi:hypothetical protein